MKFSIAVFAIFTTLAMGELTKVPRSQKAVVARQGTSVQTAAMTDANGDVIPFDTAGVNKSGQK